MSMKRLGVALFVALSTHGFAVGQLPSTDQAVAHLGGEFSSHTEKVNGATIHYVRGGRGPALILIHGFPEDWYEFRNVMPLLATHFDTIAVDLRGVGGSEATQKGYDAANLAMDVHELAKRLQLGNAYIVGHDVGGMVAYAYLRGYPHDVRGIMISNVALPGLDPWDEIESLPPFWHIRFHQTGLPETLVMGHQATYFRYFLRGDRFTDSDVAHYVESYGDAAHLRTPFEIYRAFPMNASYNKQQNQSVDVPILLSSGESDAFAQYLPRIADALRKQGCTKVSTVLIGKSAHYVFEEQPHEMAELILKDATQK